ncbi:hypothetical protein TNCV_4826151 [Trichonephila clavipes]|uniref:Uncharacterized protein n=1 Tax=Trichonephila clavipes TaxID=2585209 RepID=A0A8X6RQA6_TRICX|nr:hypothetical protein TNCV_4826151 [Trichonephila clavipes]
MRKIVHAGSTARTMVNISWKQQTPSEQIYDELTALQSVFLHSNSKVTQFEMWCKFFQEEAPDLLGIAVCVQCSCIPTLFCGTVISSAS